MLVLESLSCTHTDQISMMHRASNIKPWTALLHRSNITFPDVNFVVMSEGFGPSDVDLEYEFGFLKLEDNSTAEVGGLLQAA